jgi:hypothetical protein
MMMYPTTFDPRRCDLLKVILIVFALTFPLAAKQITLRIPLDPENVAVVTFDDTRVSAADLKRWMQADEHGPYATTVFGYYADCDANDTPKMEKDIKTSQQFADELDPNKFPPELSGVVMYLKDLQLFWLWQAKQELEFLKIGTSPDAEYKGNDLAQCQAHLETLNKAQACHQVFYNWHNCVLHTMEEQLGKYPQNKWKAFLDAYGIKERVEQTMGD